MGYNISMTKNQMYAEVIPYVGKHWTRMIRIWPTLAKHPMPALVINTRTSKTAGSCCGEATYIELSLKLYQFEDNKRKMVLEILAHELIHAADRLMYGCWQAPSTARQAHGPLWKSMMQAYGLPPNTYHNLRVK